MARRWSRLNATAGLVLLLQLAVSVVSFGDGGSCPTYPEDPSWKSSFNAKELRDLRFWKKRHLRLEGTFKQGPTVLLERQESVSDWKQSVKMVVRTASPSNSRGVYDVSVSLTLGFRSAETYPFDDKFGRVSRASNDAQIVGDGTYDETAGILCVIGCIQDVCQYKLNLKYPAPKTILDVSVEGNLTSTVGASHRTYFDPVSIHAFADAPFEYTKNATVESVCPSLPRDVNVGKRWNYEDSSDDICDRLYPLVWQPILVTWNPDCEGVNCSPFAEIGHAAGGNTSFLRFERLSCQESRMQANLVFSDSPLVFGLDVTDPTASDGTLLAEGIWNFETGQMCMIACRHYGKQDCKIVVTAQIPLTYTATQRSAVIGHVQSLREKRDPLYFERVTFRTIVQDSLQRMVLVSGFEEDSLFTSSKNQPEYVYTKVETAQALCPNSEEKKKKSSPGSYPSGEDWSELDFMVARDFASPATKSQPNYFDEPSRMIIITRGQKFIERRIDQMQYGGANVTGLGVIRSPPRYAEQDKIMNVSYIMDYPIGQQRPQRYRRNFGWQEPRESMAGEGLYDSNTGKLCLIGCRTVDLKHEGLQQLEGDTRKDCLTFFSIQLPSKDSSQAVKGTVKSLRDPSDDPLYFKPESFTGFTNMQVLDSSWRIDLEIVLSVLMLSFTVVFLLKQVRYSKRHPETLPYISITMLVLLCLAHMVPLVLDVESLIQDPGFGKRNSLMENKFVVRFLTMLAMLLQLRLLQLVWKSRIDLESAPAVQERVLLYLLTPLYIAGGLIAILPHALLHFKPYERGFLWRSDQGGVWWDVHAYGGLLLDFHLLPQVMANVLWGDSARTPAAPLAKPFFMGMALVRALPHLYDLCRQFRFIPSFLDTYLYANPEWEFYSVCADVMIPLLVMLLALVVAVQQCYGGRYVLPRRWRSRLEKQEYERVENSVADLAL